MGWTDPRTWVTDELVTAAIMNTHVRDNLNALNHLVVRKTADETVNNSTVLQNDDSLVLPIGANEIWLATWYPIWQSTTVADIKFAWTFPTGCSVGYGFLWSDAANAVTHYRQYTGTSPTNSNALHGQGTELVGPAPMNLHIVNGSTSGNVTLQWAQNTAEVSNTIVKANSTLWAVKLA